VQDRRDLAVVELQLLGRDVGDDRDLHLLEVRLGAPVVAEGGHLLINGQHFAGIGSTVIGEYRAGDKVSVVVRPEMISTAAPGGEIKSACVEVIVSEVLFSGAVQQIVGQLPDGSHFIAHEQAVKPPPERGSRVSFYWDGSLSWLVSR